MDRAATKGESRITDTPLAFVLEWVCGMTKVYLGWDGHNKCVSHLAVKSLFCERGRPRCYQAPEPGTRHWPLWATTILYSLALYPTVLFFGLVAICYGILDVCWSMVAHLIIFVRDAPGSFFQLLEMSCSRHISYMYRWCLAKYIISITLYIFVCATYVHLSLYQAIIVSYLYNQLSVLLLYIYSTYPISRYR